VHTTSTGRKKGHFMCTDTAEVSHEPDAFVKAVFCRSLVAKMNVVVLRLIQWLLFFGGGSRVGVEARRIKDQRKARNSVSRIAADP
jgi:hypothetical protein